VGAPQGLVGAPWSRWGLDGCVNDLLQFGGWVTGSP